MTSCSRDWIPWVLLVAFVLALMLFGGWAGS